MGKHIWRCEKAFTAVPRDGKETAEMGKTAEYQTDNENAVFNVFAAVVPVGSLQADYGAVVEEFFNISNIPKVRYESCPR